MKSPATLVNALSDAELKEAVQEMKAFDETGVLPQGALCRVMEALQDRGTKRPEAALGFARLALFEAAAFKWAGT